ncbi:MAG: VPLPA-CTERM sorting domain-containing protein [Pseudomonadota bacterium]
MKNIIKICLITGIALSIAGVGQAATVFTSGMGSAVTSVDAAADFEDNDALFDNPYTEDGMEFSRTALSFNNNGCGFAGCGTHLGFYSGPTPFTGNYMYGSGGGTFTIQSTGSDVFTALELILGTGNSSAQGMSYSWQTFLSGNLVGSGTTARLAVPGWYGWSDASGFDTVVFGQATGNAPAFDSVRAQFVDPAPIPLPAAGWLMLVGLGGLSALRRRKKAE